MRKINKTLIKSALLRIVDKLEMETSEDIEVSEDAYKLIPTSRWWITYPEEHHSLVYSLHDDIDEIENLATNPKRPCTYVDFDRMASILRYISEVENPS
ncbi:MAG: hypothetical protein EOP56_09035 [Sphingobacteriales bacterium]|nr:MAG: hypothetical protein EOP56_09035 [Sphingobacteriales bacterium]